MKSLRLHKPVCGHIDDWHSPETQTGAASTCQRERPEAGKGSTSQRGLASASLASQWAGTGPQSPGKVAVGASRS